MRNFDSLDASRLLAIHAPESLFSFSAPEARREYKCLVARWHPDQNNDSSAHEVFNHVILLYKLACQSRAAGTWDEPAQKVEDEQPGIKLFRLCNGSIKRIKYVVSHRFELGVMYIGEHYLTFEIAEDFFDLFSNACDRLDRLPFADEAMAAEISRFLPQVLDKFRTRQSRICVVRKTPDQLLLSDVIAKQSNGGLASEHVAWIMNSLLNLACYFRFASVTHNAISAQTVFVSPLRHSVAVLGGWWYSQTDGESIRALPDVSLKLLPSDMLFTRIADSRLDLESIKAIGRQLLEHCVDASGKLSMQEQHLAQWLEMPSTGSAIEDYAAWKYGVLPRCFGEPRFVNWNLDTVQLYKEK